MDTEPKGIIEEIYLTEKEYPPSNLVQKLSVDEYVETLTMHAANIIGDKLKCLAKERTRFLLKKIYF